MLTTNSLNQRRQYNMLERNDELEALQETMSTTPKKAILAYTKRSFILQAYRKLCLGTMDVEEFFKVGDIDGVVDTQYDGINFEACSYIDTLYHKNPIQITESILIIEQSAKMLYIAQGGNYQQLEQDIQNLGSELYAV